MKMEPAQELLQHVRQLYPKRDGSQRWGDALNHLRARLKEGEETEIILEGIKRYAAWCRERDMEHTPYVQQAATFLGRNRGYLEDWDLPVKEVKINGQNGKLSAAERCRIDSEERLRRLGDGQPI